MLRLRWTEGQMPEQVFIPKPRNGAGARHLFLAYATPTLSRMLVIRRDRVAATRKLLSNKSRSPGVSRDLTAGVGVDSCVIANLNSSFIGKPRQSVGTRAGVFFLAAIPNQGKD